jgi:predicted TIM-barrel fold metal-dependent hydrolase
MDPKNAFGQAGLMFDNHLYAFHNALTPESDRHKLPPEEFLREWTPSDIRKMVFEESDTDMLVAMPLPLTDLFRDGLSPWESCADLASRDPDRTVFWGSVNPDMDGAAANFPDINFVIFHVGLPFLDETCWQLIRYPNLYASIAATINFVVRAPRMFAEILGKLLFWCGEDKIIYGSEAPLFHPQWALRAFMDFQIPQDLCDGYGYPQLTDQAKRKILGENLLRLHGMNLDEAKAKVRA